MRRLSSSACRCCRFGRTWSRSISTLYEEMFRLTEELMVTAAGAELTNPARIQNDLTQRGPGAGSIA